MIETVRVQGRELAPADLTGIRELIAAHPQWSRRRLSEVLAAQWNWRNGKGQLKDMAARNLLLKLQARGWVRLPARRCRPTHRMARLGQAEIPWAPEPITGTVAALGPLQVSEVSGQREPRQGLVAALRQFHYLGYRGAVGENLQYIVRDRHGRPLAFLLFGAAAWKCQDRDRFIGWAVAQRERNLGQLTNQSRFLVLPWVQVGALASWSLSHITRRLARDWQRKYGHGVALVETFVERDRFGGTAYRAANWQWVGVTTGRTRQDPHHRLGAPVKDIYVYPLRADFREVLRA